VIKYRPTSPGRRGMMGSDFSALTGERPEKGLTVRYRNSGGRNNQGRMTTKCQGSGHKQRYRLIDFRRRDKEGIPAQVLSIQYDPQRTARIALLLYKDGEKRYILSPEGLQQGQTLLAGREAEIRPGNAMELKQMPLGTNVHNIELRPGKGGQLARTAGAMAQLIAKDEEYCQLRMPSGEVRRILSRCYATVGQVGNINHENIVVGKAGRNRWRGIRPRTRAVAMNPIDHPMGGGEGKSSGGRHPCSRNGIPAKGYKTRRNKRTAAFIVSRRKK
jgi:large subunit ribosomal protein L2